MFSGPFLPKFRQKCIFFKNQALSVFRYYNDQTSCKKSEKTNDRFSRNLVNRQTERQKGGQTDRKQ